MAQTTPKYGEPGVPAPCLRCPPLVLAGPLPGLGVPRGGAALQLGVELEQAAGLQLQPVQAPVAVVPPHHHHTRCRAQH